MNARDAARMIDISAVRTQHTLDDIMAVVTIAKKYQFINVHALPNWVADLSRLLKDEKEVFVGAPVGFPGGGHKTSVKLLEAKELIADGVQEMDIVMNVGRFKHGEYDYVLDELDQVIGLAPDGVKTKVIIEINCLSDAEMDLACGLVMKTKADFIKTGTGWVSGNANVERIRRIKSLTDGKIRIKAAGGIRSRKEFDALVAMGVERFGINTKSAMDIIESFQ
ncbi:deoxyribose-phosphate aldolase [Christensenella timonensis]|uniref:deoxyribose-phosphate aldolase n=1 Tax=Christensenella timonensis TaxID=1816678 RepID=UPI0013902821|nr:deoxyribose-phosphate aldolase [Christensenella timonensis]